MALVVRNAASLKPEIRLAQALSEFEAKLNTEHKAAFRNARAVARKTPPTPSDVMRLTAEIDSRVRQEHGPSRCFGPRLTNILQAVQQFAALGDTVVGGSQNIVACGVWSAVRMMLHMAIGYASYLEKLSLLFMTAGRQAPRYQALAIIYPQSKALQSYLSEYFIVIVHICQSIQQYARKSTFGQFKSSLNDADLKEYEADLAVWGNSIKDEATLLLNQRFQNESQENEKARALVAKWSTSSTQQRALQRKMRWLNASSTYDFQTTWKQIRKRGSTSLLPTWAEYQKWKQETETPSAILFSGKIGAGKSVTMANIVDDLYLSGYAIVVYFFCRHDITQSLASRTILGSLASQYLSNFPDNNGLFKEDVPTLGLSELVALMMPKHNDRPRFLLVDGLDECSIEEQRSVLTQLSWLQKKSDWRIAFSSRLSAVDFIPEQINLKWHVSLPTNNPDIEQYIDSELQARLANGQLKVGNPNLVPEIRAALLDGANGMFLWVALQLDQICFELSDHSIRLAIQSLPRDLSEVYARILRTSAARDAGQYHIRLFKFLAAAYVPLNIAQMREMASVTIGDTTWDPSKCINDAMKVLGFCGSLVMIEEEEQTVRFIHHSARSFCQGVLGGLNHWENSFSDEEAHREIGETAVTYLSYGIFDTRLSTQVVPKVDVGGVTKRIVERTLGTEKPVSRLALRFVRPKQDKNRNRDIGQFLAQVQGDDIAVESETITHPFLPYAKKFWVLHTGNIQDSFVRKLWDQLFDDVNVHDFQLTPHVLGPLDSFETSYKHPLASAFVWAVNYSHIAMFDRLMDLHGSCAFSTKLPWARFRFFRSLLQYLHPRIQGAAAKGPRLQPTMIQRLLPLAIILRVYHTVEWMLPCVDHTDLLTAFETAIHCGNHLSAAFISTNRAFRISDEVILSELLTTAVSSRNVQMVSLLVRMAAASSTDINAWAAISSILYSGMHQAALLRMIFILANAGTRLDTFNQRHISAAVQLLALSPEINTEIASEAIARILWEDPDFPEFHKRTFRQACSIGSFELAYTTWLSFFDFEARNRGVDLTSGSGVSMTSTYPFEGDELRLVLQTVSMDRVILADWLIEVSTYGRDREVFLRTIMLRNWQLAGSLLTKHRYAVPGDTLAFCSIHELLHLSVIQQDLRGIEFLTKIGVSFKSKSTGPIFRHKTVMQALMTQDSSCFIHMPIAELVRRGAFTRKCACSQIIVLKQKIGHLLSPDIGATWDPEVQSIMNRVIGSGSCAEKSSHSWLVYLLVAPMRKIVRTHFVPQYGDIETGLKHLANWCTLLEQLPDPVSVYHDHQGVFILREIFGITADMDDSSSSGPESLSFPGSRWHVQMRFWKLINHLFMNSFSSNTCTTRTLRELSVWLDSKPLDGIFPGWSRETHRARRKRVQGVLLLAATNEGLPWILQYMLMRSQHFSIRDFVDFSESLYDSTGGVWISSKTQQAFQSMGWTKYQLADWIEVVKPQIGENFRSRAGKKKKCSADY